MESPKKKAGRPVVPPGLRKKPRAISMTDAEYLTLEEKAKAAQMGVSAFAVSLFNAS